MMKNFIYSDDSWLQNSYIRKNSAELPPGDPALKDEIWSRYKLSIVESADLDGATIEEVRTHYLAWSRAQGLWTTASPIMPKCITKAFSRPPTADDPGALRHNDRICLLVDEELLHCVLSPEEDSLPNVPIKVVDAEFNGTRGAKKQFVYDEPYDWIDFGTGEVHYLDIMNGMTVMKLDMSKGRWEDGGYKGWATVELRRLIRLFEWADGCDPMERMVTFEDGDGPTLEI
jgi:hypothetical protein